MNIDLKREGSTLEAAIEGRLDTNSSPQLEAALKEAFSIMPAQLVINLTDVQYVSSAGLRVILFAQKEISRAGASMVVRNPNEYVYDVFEATGFSDILTIEREV